MSSGLGVRPPWPSRCSSLPSSSFRFASEPKVIGVVVGHAGLDELTAALWKIEPLVEDTAPTLPQAECGQATLRDRGHERIDGG